MEAPGDDERPGSAPGLPDRGGCMVGRPDGEDRAIDLEGFLQMVPTVDVAPCLNAIRAPTPGCDHDWQSARFDQSRSSNGNGQSPGRSSKSCSAIPITSRRPIRTPVRHSLLPSSRGIRPEGLFTFAPDARDHLGLFLRRSAAGKVANAEPKRCAPFGFPEVPGSV